MPSVEVSGLYKGFGDNGVLKDINFKIAEGEYVVVLGPSGCGKTTLLKTMAGIYQPDSGSMMLDGEDITSVQPENRGIGFFFQHYSLFPHMTVEENVGYSLKVRGVGVDEVRRVVDEYVSLVGLRQWKKHMPHELSGGMQQRVALARALAKGSKLLLLDEPLNALDAKIASTLRKELKHIQKKMGLTVVHVTPNQGEAMELADRIIVLKDGRIIQDSRKNEVYLRPKTPFTAYFVGESNFLKARKVDAHTVRYRGKLFSVTDEIKDDEVLLAVRIEKVGFEHHERNTLEGVVESVNFLGRTTRYECNCSGRYVHAETSKHPNLKVGDMVSVHFPPDDLIVYPAGDEVDEEITVI